MLTTITSAAQQECGIKFESDSSWHDILSIAKSEDKFIFVDCYASWCVPCKAMDNNVFTKKEVGEYINDKFISVRVRMDTSYQSLLRQFRIDVYPTYLFFSPEGIIVHRDNGYKSIPDFLNLLKEAANPQTQYYTLLRAYDSGISEYRNMPWLAYRSLRNGDTAHAGFIAKDYINNYLFKSGDSDLYAMENIRFMAKFIKGSHGKDFWFFYTHSGRIDKIMGRKGYSREIVEHIITEEEIAPQLWRGNIPKNDHPAWNSLTSVISRKYGREYAKKAVLDAQIGWYNYKMDWTDLIKSSVHRIEEFGLDTAGLGTLYLNNFIWTAVFLHSDSKEIINKAISWEEIIIKGHPGDFPAIDTYANLLYKAGRVREAVSWEEKVDRLDEEDAKRNKRIRDMDYERTLHKMLAGIRTWSSD